MWSLKDVYRAFRYRYRLDRNEISFILSSISKGDVAVDVGAHKGGYTYWFQKRVGSSGKCYAFEPQPTLFSSLELKTRDYGNIECLPLGVSSSIGQFDLFIPGNRADSPGATLQEANITSIERRVSIKTTTIDHFFLERKPPVFIKIDVEGHEIEVLKGAKSTLKNCKPSILMECELRHIETPIEEVFTILLDLGYSGFFYYKSKRMPISTFTPSFHQPQVGERYWASSNYVNNFMFTHSTATKKGNSSFVRY